MSYAAFKIVPRNARAFRAAAGMPLRQAGFSMRNVEETCIKA